ncbi:FtsK/SpoIIIE family DNA translocase [Hyphococcus luteus]|uniref:DNA translocase FtsK n=1 Tax=Hyphococcus luteus TaxID=2058213 RepID=A0A2S7K6U2_9PROT|nr:DNA translocase FtsK 4TM domain-containing protein [Marinicaulis flavus]PQA88235.1 cell division protein FtsK [Marinicaulis flavus]
MSSTTRTYTRSGRSRGRRDPFAELADRLRSFSRAVLMRAGGAAMVLIGLWLVVSLATFTISDPSFNTATSAPVQNLGGAPGAIMADLLLQFIGGAAFLLPAPLALWGAVAALKGAPEETPSEFWPRLVAAPAAILAGAAFLATWPVPADWPYVVGAGGLVGGVLFDGVAGLVSFIGAGLARALVGGVFAMAALVSYSILCGLTRDRLADAWWAIEDSAFALRDAALDLKARFAGDADDIEEDEDGEDYDYEDDEEIGDLETEYDEDGEPVLAAPARKRKIIREKAKKKKESRRERREAQPSLPVFSAEDYELPPLNLLAKPNIARRTVISDEALEQNARMLENVLADFGVRGEIINVRPGPVVTLYELEPAAGVKSSRVIGLADDIARSMSAVACRVAVVPGRNVIGIELPNQDREMVMLRELLGAEEYENSGGDLTLALGKSIGGEPVFADLARMPHLLIAGTTGSGKSVGINTMILSLLYRLSPEHCKLILIDPKMLELSVYEGIPHLLSPVVTDPRKAVVALKWTVREMEERYRKMSKVGVRNVEGFNARVAEAEETGEVLSRTVHTGYDEDTGEPVYETEELEYEPMPFIVVVIDEVADLMMVAGKDIEGMVQRLAQMARAAGIHLIMATQRPSVDVITGTIKANFPTRISFQVTSKIDSRTILGEQGAEQLLGQGDMLHMAGGGRLRRVHGAFVSDDEVEKIVKHLKKQGAPDYVQEVTEMRDEDGGEAGGFDIGGNTSSGDALYDKAVAVVVRDRKASTSYVQRRLQIGYNRAATLIEKMEEEGVISAANHAGKREVLVGDDAA